MSEPPGLRPSDRTAFSHFPLVQTGANKDSYSLVVVKCTMPPISDTVRMTVGHDQNRLSSIVLPEQVATTS
jgi:hypothetical protein